MQQNHKNDLLNQLLSEIHSLKETQTNLLLKIELYQKENQIGIKNLTEKLLIKEIEQDTVEIPNSLNLLLISEDVICDVNSTTSINNNTNNNTSRFSTPYSPNNQIIDSTTPGVYTQRIILTTYPNQAGVNPLGLNWGENDPFKRVFIKLITRVLLSVQDIHLQSNLEMQLVRNLLILIRSTWRILFNLSFFSSCNGRISTCSYS